MNSSTITSTTTELHGADTQQAYADAPHRVDLGGDAWIEIRPYITRGERKAINAAATTRKTRQVVDTKTRQGRIESYLDINDDEWEMGLLERIILRWSFPEPVTREAINGRSERHINKVLREFDRLNPDEESDEGKASGVAATPISDQDADPFQTNWPGS